MIQLIKNHLSLFLVLLAIIINLIALFPETTIKSELNDNVFAFVLVNQMDKAWDAGRCPFSLSCLPSLTDHWVSTFALGFPVPHYYQHLPHLTVVVLYRLLSNFPLQPTTYNLFSVFEWFKYLLLAFFPLSIYWAARKLELPPLAAGLAALVSPLISTQYLYGTDFNAVVWRGSGMYTQLWGFVAAPLALGSLYDTIRYGRSVLRSALLLALTFSGHLIFGYIVLLTSPFIVLSVVISHLSRLSNLLKSLFPLFLRLGLVLGLTFLFLSYWAVPLFLDNAWHNSHSVWDARDKFDSYGMLAVTQKLLNGDIFDANRLPVMTILVAVGFFAAIIAFTSYFTNKSNWTNLSNLQPASLLLLPLMFVEWYFLYWGRATWGPLISFLPLSDGIHLHRFINGLHLAGIFLAGVGLHWLMGETFKLLKSPKLFRLPKIIPVPLTVILLTIILLPIYSERLTYLRDNAGMIKNNNLAFDQDYPDFQKTVEFLKSRNPPTGGRVWPGRPGNWGDKFNVGGTHAFMQFSMADIDGSGFLPETWSPNSDVEQFFDENRFDHYQALGIKTIVAPPDHEVPKFAKKIAQFGKFVVYDVPEVTEFEVGTVPLQVVANKKSDLSALRLWLESAWPSYRAHPAISLTDKPLQPTTYNLQPTLRMLNLSNYVQSDQLNKIIPISLFEKNPFSVPPPEATPTGKIVSERRSFNTFSATVSLPKTAKQNYLVLKASYHPSWRAYIDNQPTKIIPVAPVFMAIPFPPCQGLTCTYTVEFKYGPTATKNILLAVSLGAVLTAVVLRKRFDSFLLHSG